MYPHPQINSFIQDCNPQVPRKILNSTIEKGMRKHAVVYEEYLPSKIFRLASTQPECFAPRVDVTRAPLACGPYALPKLKKELKSEQALVVRQAVTTLGDLLVNPEKMMEAVSLRIHDILADLLASEDPYVRERAALIHVIMGHQAAGQEAVLSNCVAVTNLYEGLDEPIVPIRFKMAQAVESLAHHGPLADEFCCNLFVEIITSKLIFEQEHILLVFLDTLQLLLQRDFKANAIQGGTFDTLVKLLNRKDEKTLCKALGCLTILCEDICGKKKADELDLMCTVYRLIKDKRQSISTEAGRLSAFITVTTPGKLRFLEVGLMTPFLMLASGKCCCSGELLLWIIKTLTNVAEAPKGRRLLCEEHFTLVENIETGSDLLRRHKEILLDVIKWKP